MIIRLGTGIAEIIPFRRYDKPTLTKQQEDKGFITKKILTIMGNSSSWESCCFSIMAYIENECLI